eukprot:5146241-Prymnesium_polylepis.1
MQRADAPPTSALARRKRCVHVTSAAPPCGRRVARAAPLAETVCTLACSTGPPPAGLPRAGWAVLYQGVVSCNGFEPRFLAAAPGGEHEGGDD